MAAGDVQHKDGVLNMENYGNLPVQAFEITERPRTTATPPSTFTYQRSAKRSIMLGLGIAPGASTEATPGEDPLNAYSKMTDTACVLTYLSIVVGAGTFSLSKSVAAIGLVQGSLVLMAFSVWNYAQSELLFRLPQLLERNFDTYTSIARACFSSWFSNIFLLLSAICWWCVCVFNLLMLEDTLERVAICWGGEKHRGEVSFAATLVCLLPGLAFICKTRGNELVTVSKVAIRSMVAVAAMEIVCAIGHYTTHLVNQTPVRSVAWRTAGGPEEVGLASSISGMVVAFAGVGCWPYVLADMLHPQNAAKVVRKASLIIGIFYLCALPGARAAQAGLPVAIPHLHEGSCHDLRVLETMHSHHLGTWNMFRHRASSPENPWLDLPALTGVRSKYLKHGVLLLSASIKDLLPPLLHHGDCLLVEDLNCTRYGEAISPVIAEYYGARRLVMASRSADVAGVVSAQDVMQPVGEKNVSGSTLIVQS